jgi:MFS family permease
MHWPVLLAGLGSGSATLFVLLATWAPDFAMVSLLAIPSGLLGGGWSVGLNATVQYLLPAHIRASGTALYIAVATLVGQIAGPFAVGLASDRMGGDADALQLALTFVIPLGFAGAACALLAARHVVADREALARAA